MCPLFIQAQPAGNIQGVVTDVASGQALSGVSVIAVNSSPVVGATTGATGHFSLNNLTVGRYTVQCTRAGYEPANVKEILVSSAKDVFIEISLRENIRQRKEASDHPGTDMDMALNPTSAGRTFNAEEASRYAGGFDDPARLAAAYSGVAGNMGDNGIAIRGNPSQYLQWRIEGIESVNPTHFTDIDKAGSGIITALSPRLLGSTGFFKGAFPAEYGNALSGVFDMQLRNGNSQHNEHSAEMSTLGVGFSTEGPFTLSRDSIRRVSTYLLNYRYTSLGMLGDIFPDMVGDAAKMRMHDLSFKFNFPSGNMGTITVWGIGVIDHLRQQASGDTAHWRNTFFNNAFYRQIKYIGGIGYQIPVGGKSFLKSVLAMNHLNNQINMEQVYSGARMRPVNVADMSNKDLSVAFNTYINIKFGSMHSNRTGFNITGLFFDTNYWISPDINRIPPGAMLNYLKGTGSSALFSAFTQSSFRLTYFLQANVGLLGMYFRLNGRATVEPRIGIHWRTSVKHAVGLAYGKHSRRENLDYYFVETSPEEGAHANKNLDFSKSHQLALIYDWKISEHLNLKVEPYYQYLYDIPMEEKSQQSLINQRDFFMMTPLVNGGKGKNYGIDVTLDRRYFNSYYYLITASLFDSRATGKDGLWQNTRLKRNYIFNALGGKEWIMGKQSQNILSVSIRFTFQGGERYIPVDEEKSRISRSIVYDYSHAYKVQLPSELITHLTVGYKIYRNRSEHEIYVKIINATGLKEFDKYCYNYRTKKSEMYMKAGMLPNIGYRIYF